MLVYCAAVAKKKALRDILHIFDGEVARAAIQKSDTNGDVYARAQKHRQGQVFHAYAQ